MKWDRSDVSFQVVMGWDVIYISIQRLIKSINPSIEMENPDRLPASSPDTSIAFVVSAPYKVIKN